MKSAKNKQNIIGLKDLRLKTEEYIRRVDKGESFTVVKRSKPIFKIVPFHDVDEGIWETVLDFTELDPKGVLAKDVIKALRKLNGQNL